MDMCGSVTNGARFYHRIDKISLRLEFVFLISVPSANVRLAPDRAGPDVQYDRQARGEGRVQL